MLTDEIASKQVFPPLDHRPPFKSLADNHRSREHHFSTPTSGTANHKSRHSIGTTRTRGHRRRYCELEVGNGVKEVVKHIHRAKRSCFLYSPVVKTIRACGPLTPRSSFDGIFERTTFAGAWQMMRCNESVSDKEMQAITTQPRSFTFVAMCHIERRIVCSMANT